MKSDPYDGAVKAIVDLEAEKQAILLEEVAKVLVASGAMYNNLLLADGLSNALLEFAAQEGVRDNVWKACTNALKE
jgi:hypothetical protein